jgi:hypothetical protein
MPTVKLSDYECKRDLLPDVCMFCGAPAATRLRRTFTWTPGWVWILLLVNLIVLAVVAMLVTKKMTVNVPVCEEHEGYWRRKNLLMLMSLLGVTLICIGGVVIVTTQDQRGNDDLTGWACGGSIAFAVVWLIFVGVLSTRGVRPVHITEDTVQLTAVHDDFIAALREERARFREHHGRVGYGDERDDYDDEFVDEPPRRRRRDEDDRRERRRRDD